MDESENHTMLQRPKSTPARSSTARSATPRSPSTVAFCSCPSARLPSRQSTPMTPRCTSATFTHDHEVWNGHESTEHTYHDLINYWNLKGLQWIACSGGQMPSRAVQGGHTRSGEPLYIARALTPTLTSCIGAFRPATGRCHIQWRGTELRSSVYEILCHRSRLQRRSPLYTTPTTPQLCDTLKVQSLRNPLKVTNIDAIAATLRVQQLRRPLRLGLSYATNPYAGTFNIKALQRSLQLSSIRA